MWKHKTITPWLKLASWFKVSVWLKLTAWLMVICMLAGMQMINVPLKVYAVGAPWDGTGISGDPYIIATAEDLVSLSNEVYKEYWGAYFEQTADISLADVGWEPIGTYASPFTGCYDGGGHTVSNLSINKPVDDEVGYSDLSAEEGGLKTCMLQVQQ
jgi:hypothetical protein